MHPFEQYELYTVLQSQPAKIQERIDNFTDDEIMANDLKILAHNVCEEFRIDPLELHEEDTERRDIKNGKIQKWFDPVRYFTPERRGAYREVDGVTLTFVFPFSGQSMIPRLLFAASSIFWTIVENPFGKRSVQTCQSPRASSQPSSI